LSKDETIKEIQRWNEYIDSCLRIQTGFSYISMMGIQKLAEALYDAIKKKEITISSVLNIKQIKRLVYLCLCVLGNHKINEEYYLEWSQLLCENEDRKNILVWLKKYVQKEGITVDEINGYSVFVCYSFKTGLPQYRASGFFETEGDGMMTWGETPESK
jgi:hypothetical protein